LRNYDQSTFLGSAPHKQTFLYLFAASHSRGGREAFGCFRVGRRGQSLAYRGGIESLLSTLRYYALGGLAQIYEDAGKAKIPTLLFWADAETTVPYDGAAKVVPAMPSARLVTFPGGGHGINKTAANKVNALMVDFFTAWSGRRTAGEESGK
jgi:pimeloyl-ACP methyl ester carboxylesterase